MKITLVLAMAENGVIGRDNGLPWRLSTDMKRFKSETMGKPIIMGRKTWDSFPRKPLPGRINIVLSRDKDFQPEGAEVVRSLQNALTLADAHGHAMPGIDEVCVIGGAQVYLQALPLADRLLVTHVLAEVEGDATFPPVDPSVWEPLREENVPAGEKDSYPTRFVVYERRSESS